MKPVKDNFSEQSGSYARYRPVYPRALYDWLFSKLSSFERAWDVGTGNGQVALELAEKFDVVLATDVSEPQLKKAPQRENILYRVSRAEQTDLPSEFFDLITVAQALHWFDFGPFFQEVQRVAKPGAWFAAWGYTLAELEDDIDPIIREFYFDTTGPYWDPERGHIDNQLADVPFPFELIETPEFAFELDWELKHIEGFINSWSAVQHYKKKKGTDPVPEFIEKLKPHWPSGKSRRIRFPIFLKMGQL